MNAQIVEMELFDTDVMREDGPTILNLPVDATLEDVFHAPICPDLRDLFRRTLNGPLTSEKRGELTIRQTLENPELAPKWIGALIALNAHAAASNTIGDAVQLERHLAHPTDQIASVCLPLNVPGRMWCETQIAPADGPALGAMAVIDLDAQDNVRSARLILTGLGSVPVSINGSLKQLNGQPLTDDTINAVAAAVVQEVAARGFSVKGATDQLAEITRAAFKTCRKGDCSQTN
ncbi:MAG: hypothetical protein JXA10_08340 [Anaerolineae bacterium]|nr:hypothetical protein [Anaerolineae bacterium]